MVQTPSLAEILLERAKILLDQGDYTDEVKATAELIRDILASETEKQDIPEGVQSELARKRDALIGLLTSMENQDRIEVKIYDTNLLIVRDDNTPEMYHFHYGDFQKDIPEGIRRVLIGMIQQHPEYLYHDKTSDRNTFKHIADMFEMGFGEICDDIKTWGIGFKRDQGEEMNSKWWALGNGERLRIDESFTMIALQIDSKSYKIRKIFGWREYIIQLSQRSTYHRFEIYDEIARILRKIAQGDIPPPNPHNNNGLAKIWLKIVRKGWTPSLEIIPDSALAKLN